MLVLSRKVGQEIMIGDSIRLVVVEVRRGQVRLAFAAPSDVPIHRREVYRQVVESEDDAAVDDSLIGDSPVDHSPVDHSLVNSAPAGAASARLISASAR